MENMAHWTSADSAKFERFAHPNVQRIISELLRDTTYPDGHVTYPDARMAVARFAK